MKILLFLLLTGALLPGAHAQTGKLAPDVDFFGQRTPSQQTPAPTVSPSFEEDALRPAAYLVTGADDFVVEVYLNGKLVPAEQRELLAEIFGASAEKIKAEVKPGDWVVFNVVNNRLRWGGAAYFGVAGMDKDGKPVFVSRLSDTRWTCCDDLNKVGDFIAQKEVLGEPVLNITNVWGDGRQLMNNHAFEGWNGDPIWGKTPNTWIKFVYR